MYEVSTSVYESSVRNVAAADFAIFSNVINTSFLATHFPRCRDSIKKPVDERVEDESIVGYSFLFESYKPKFWWFELAETSRRLALTGILATVKPGTETQLFSGILLSLIAIVVTTWFQPYHDGRDNVIAVSMNLQIALITLTALALKRAQEVGTDSPDEAYDEKGMGVLLIVFNVLLIFVFIFYGWGEITR